MIEISLKKLFNDLREKMINRRAQSTPDTHTGTQLIIPNVSKEPRLVIK